MNLAVSGQLIVQYFPRNAYVSLATVLQIARKPCDIRQIALRPSNDELSFHLSLWFVIQKKIYNSQGKTNHYDRRKSVLRLSCKLKKSCNFAAKLNTPRYWSATIRLPCGLTISFRTEILLQLYEYERF